MKKLFLSFLMMLTLLPLAAANKYDNPDTIVVSRDGTGEFRTIDEAIEVCRAFMDYSKVIYVKKGVYKEKLILPSWLTNITICGEDRDNTIITWDDHANIKMPVGGLDSEAAVKGKPMGTFRTYTLKVQGSYITLKNITIENNAAKLGHDFIFGPGRAWFENCEIRSKANSYITAASSPAGQEYGYVFNKCKLTAEPGVDKVYLGRPWRPYAATLFMNCEMGSHIRPEGWHNWGKQSNEQTARYSEYNNHGAGAATKGRVAWSRQLTKKEAAKVTIKNVFGEEAW